MHVNDEADDGAKAYRRSAVASPLALDALSCPRCMESPRCDRNGLNGDQRVLLGWSPGAWRTKEGPDAALRQLVVSDPHRASSSTKVNRPVRNVDAWYESFGVKPGDKLYLAPEGRVRIWYGASRLTSSGWFVWTVNSAIIA